MKITTLAVSLFLLAIGNLASASCQMNESGYAAISGEYICAYNCSTNGVGKSAYITQNSNSLILINEFGLTSSATISGYTVQASGLTATVANNCQELLFSNGTVWLRRGNAYK